MGQVRIFQRKPQAASVELGGETQGCRVGCLETTAVGRQGAGSGRV
jgi:hypothetical protein